MNSSLYTTRASSVSEFFVITPEEMVKVDEHSQTRFNAGIDCLIEQEVLGRRNEKVPSRLLQLSKSFGFEWEPLSEPGHMRFLGYAAFMLNQAKIEAERIARSNLKNLDIPAFQVDGVSLVNPSAPAMYDYLKLTSINEGLYGDSPYKVASEGLEYILRQTSCVQKYSACLSRQLKADSLPVALFEISDSFRREPVENLQLCYRLRRFHLPETHIHTRNIDEAVQLSFGIHRQIQQNLLDLEADFVLLISASQEFAKARQDYFKLIASIANNPVLLKVTPSGKICEDGVELDVEYKLIDSVGCCRELSTFQIDEQITRAIGLVCEDGTVPATIHTVFCGGVERLIYFILDRIVRSESDGIKRRLPLWLTPVEVRIIASDESVVRLAFSVAQQLSIAGLRTEIDDRSQSLEAAIRDADSLLIPYLIWVNNEHNITVRDYQTETFKKQDISELLAQIGRDRTDHPSSFERLSRQPFCTPND